MKRAIVLMCLLTLLITTGCTATSSTTTPDPALDNQEVAATTAPKKDFKSVCEDTGKFIEDVLKGSAIWEAAGYLIFH
jgi:cytochrome oxidase Cu insertion factor (SCO1/SenC/PrrC family)